MLTTKIRINDDKAKRFKDANGYLIINDNPIAKAGVFDYLEREIIKDSNSNKVVKVYRPFENLSETKDNFAKKPILYNHDWVGDGKNSVDGAIGDVIIAKEPYLVADLIIYNPELINAIENDAIKELSPGYTCSFLQQKGIYDNQDYDFIQTIDNVNHLAVVENGRSGSDLRILDKKIDNNKGNNNMKIISQKVLDGLKRMIKDETPDKLLSELDRIKSIPDDDYEGGAEAKLQAIKELQAKLDLVEDEDKKEVKVDDLDKRELIREIMALSGKNPSDFNGGEDEQVEAIAKLAEKLAYSNQHIQDNDLNNINNDDKDINISVETLKEIIEKVTDAKVNEHLNKITNDNKKVFDSYQEVKNVIGDFNYSGKNANEIYAFGYECLTKEKLDKALDAKTAFLFASQNKATNNKKVFDTAINDDKVNRLSNMLDNIK